MFLSISFVEPLLKGALSGLAYGMLLGPLFFLSIRTTLKYGMKPGITQVAGAFSSDIMLIMTSWWSADKLEELASNHAYQNGFGIVASLILFVLGLSALVPRKRELGRDLNEKRPVLKHRYAFLQGFSVNTSNPSNWIFWLGVATAAHADAPDNDEIFVRLFMLAAVFTLFCSDLSKAYIAHRVSTKLKPTTLLRVIQASGIILIFVSLWIFYGIARNNI